MRNPESKLNQAASKVHAYIDLSPCKVKNYKPQALAHTLTHLKTTCICDDWFPRCVKSPRFASRRHDMDKNHRELGRRWSVPPVWREALSCCTAEEKKNCRHACIMKSHTHCRHYLTQWHGKLKVTFIWAAWQWYLNSNWHQPVRTNHSG